MGLNTILRWFGVCRHPHTYLERRHLHGVLVPHYMCESCHKNLGPVIRRAPSQHVKAFHEGSLSSVSRRAPARLRAVK